MDYQRSLMLEQAKELLEEYPLPIVAEKCGFSTLKGFKLAYHKKFGSIPISKGQKIASEELT